MRTLITGASGLLGRELMKSFKDCEVVGTALNRHNGNDIIKMDLKNKEEILQILEEKNPQIIVHAAAERRPDVCKDNLEHTKQINVESTKIIAEYSADKNDCFLLYISTDYVFDGTNPPYKPNDEPNPLNEYGVSKLEGEKVIWETKQSAGILRIPYLYGFVEHIDESGVTGLIKHLQLEKLQNNEQVENVEVDDHYIRYPTFAGDVAEVVNKLAKRRFKHCGLTGTWHFTGNEATTKYKIVVTIAELLGVSHSHIIPIKNNDSNENSNNNNGIATRPYDSHLDNTALKLMKMNKVSNFTQKLKEILQDLYNKNLIPIPPSVK